MTRPAEVLEEIRADPSAFYVDLHNAEFPQGAIRGQLTATGAELPRTGGTADAALLGAAAVVTGGALVLLARRREDAES